MSFGCRVIFESTPDITPPPLRSPSCALAHSSKCTSPLFYRIAYESTPILLECNLFLTSSAPLLLSLLMLSQMRASPALWTRKTKSFAGKSSRTRSLPMAAVTACTCAATAWVCSLYPPGLTSIKSLTLGQSAPAASLFLHRAVVP